MKSTRFADEKGTLEDELKKLLIPKDPNDDKNVILEIRAGTGGEEAGLFAGDLFRMYSRYAENRNWKVEILTQNINRCRGIQRNHRHDSRQRGLQHSNMKAAPIGFSGCRQPKPRAGFIRRP